MFLCSNNMTIVLWEDRQAYAKKEYSRETCASQSLDHQVMFQNYGCHPFIVSRGPDMDIWPDGIVRHLCIPVLVPWHWRSWCLERDVYGAVWISKISIWLFPKIGVTPKSSIFNRVFHYKPSILGYHDFRKPPCVYVLIPNEFSVWHGLCPLQTFWF